jgi:hypothetical protein
VRTGLAWPVALQCRAAERSPDSCAVSKAAVSVLLHARPFWQLHALSIYCPSITVDSPVTSSVSNAAGARLMTFLAGPPNHGRGAVMERHIPQAPQASSAPATYDAAFPDLNPYSYVPIAQASGSNATPGAEPVQHQNGFNNGTKPRVRLSLCRVPIPKWSRLFELQRTVYCRISGHPSRPPQTLSMTACMPFPHHCSRNDNIGGLPTTTLA